MSPTEKRKLERVRYWQGQLLRSGDFNDIHGVEEQRRWWHNRALHNAYGVHQDPDVAPGFSAAFNADRSAVVVNAGLAYDSFGRELILQTDQTVPVPPITQENQDFALLVRYRAATPDRRMDGLSAACYTNSGPLRPEFVEFAWKAKDHCAFTDGVPLAELQVQDRKTSLVPFPLPTPRPLARPLLASGSTVPGNTAWELWISELESERHPVVFGVQTTIDTSSSGFTDAPCYFAWLQGPIYDPQAGLLAPALFPSIAEEAVDSFIFRLAFPTVQTTVILSAATAGQSVQQVTAREFPSFAHKQGLYVNWVGCQKNASAPFLATFLRVPRLVLDMNLINNIFTPLIKL